MLRILVLRVLAHIDDLRAALAHGLQYPYEIVRMRVDHVGEVEAAAATLGTSDDEQVGKAATMQTEECSGAFSLPLVFQGTTAATADPVEGRSAHPLESGRIDQHVERIFNSLMDHAALVDFAHPARCSVH